MGVCHAHLIGSSDSAKIRTKLGSSPQYTDFRYGLAATIEWYRANRDWWAAVKSQIEADYAAKGQ